MIEAGRQFLTHCGNGDANAVYAILSPELKEVVDLSRVQQILPAEPQMNMVIDFDAAYLDDLVYQTHQNIPVNIKLYYHLVFEDQSEQFTRVEFSTSSGSIIGFDLDATDDHHMFETNQ